MPDKADNIDLLYSANLAYSCGALMGIDYDCLDGAFLEFCLNSKHPMKTKHYNEQVRLGKRHQKDLEARYDRNSH